jgi:outer membrane lipoprotein-sorting protein
MRRLITLPARRLWTLLAAVCVLALGAGIAQAALRSGGDKPPAKPLARAVHDALTAPPAPGISARIQFVNHLLPSGSVNGQGAGSPLLSGASGRLWLTRDGRFRLELQSGSGDAQIVSDGHTLSLYDASSNTVYRAALPAHMHGTQPKAPGLDTIRRALQGLARTWTVSGARPGNTAGQPSYTVRIAPKDDGGLLGAAELAWSSAHGTPLRAAIYAQGQSSPVVELKATKLSFASIPASDVQVSAPAGAKVVQLDSPAAHGRAKGHGKQPEVSGRGAVAQRLSFPLSAPKRLAGLPRQDVRLVSFGSERGALVTYGRGLGAIAVLERPGGNGANGDQGPLGQLPSVNIDGATGKELATALGTVVTFQRGSVAYVVAGSVPPVAAENAARGL